MPCWVWANGTSRKPSLASDERKKSNSLLLSLPLFLFSICLAFGRFWSKCRAKYRFVCRCEIFQMTCNKLTFLMVKLTGIRCNSDDFYVKNGPWNEHTISFNVCAHERNKAKWRKKNNSNRKKAIETIKCTSTGIGLHCRTEHTNTSIVATNTSSLICRLGSQENLKYLHSNWMKFGIFREN